MDAKYKTVYSDVGREVLETGLRLGLVAFARELGGVPDSGKWLAALRAHDGTVYVQKAYDSIDDAAACGFRQLSNGLLWLGFEVWHVVDGAGIVEYRCRMPYGSTGGVRWWVHCVV